DQWILSLRALIRSDYHRPSVKDEDGNMIYNNSLFLGNIRNYIEAVFDAFASKGEIDHDVLLKKVLTPELSF
nr:hypothetical protein [Alphaproteobacteria bacterium]